MISGALKLLNICDYLLAGAASAVVPAEWGRTGVLVLARSIVTFGGERRAMPVRLPNCLDRRAL
ncbi:hypothetical protein Sgleb_61730 [Streptomyces glebosus]|uniref:Uncharacterized protein n=1 Tax=Streptomyces glebosus TaxID=249580 RepID=A0A640T782_9ACTN|nr:hypothetical protein Srufu_063100 [Streptomyces libani subsp. rufus]GFE18126.1 hypothetical protein Sgleb_61730 [Streptomyces glebosus]GHG45826.1 hypothetical protein GCM10010513_01270 [Streptomyces glebosus]